MKKNQRQEPMRKTGQQKEHMEKKPEATSTANTENARLSDAQNRALKHWKSYDQYRRKTTVEGWHAGGALEEVFQELGHGGWGDWLESVGIARSTADRLRLLSKSYDIAQIEEFDSVDQALRASAARSKRKKAGMKVEPKVETKGEGASSVEKAEVTGGDDTPQVPDDTEFAQEIQQLRDKLREAEDQLRKTEDQLRKTEDRRRAAEKETADLRQENTDLRKQKDRLLQENKQLKRKPEEKGIPKETTSVDRQQIYLHRALSGNSKDPGSGGARTTAAPESRETPTPQHPETGTAIPVSEGK